LGRGAGWVKMDRALFEGNDNRSRSICILERQEGIGDAFKHIWINRVDHSPSKANAAYVMRVLFPAREISPRLQRRRGPHNGRKPQRGPRRTAQERLGGSAAIPCVRRPRRL